MMRPPCGCSRAAKAKPRRRFGRFSVGANSSNHAECAFSVEAMAHCWSPDLPDRGSKNLLNTSTFMPGWLLMISSKAFSSVSSWARRMCGLRVSRISLAPLVCFNLSFFEA